MRLEAMACLIGGVASYQVGASIAKALFPIFGPVGTVGLRIGFAAIILLLVWRPWRSVSLPGTLKRDIALYGVAMGMMNLFFYLTIARLPIGIAVALEFLGPLALAISGSRRLLDLFWAAIIVAGLGLLLRPGSSGASLDPLGVFYGVLGAAMWAAYILTGTRIGGRLSAPQTATLGMTVGSIVLLPCILSAAPVAWHHPHALLSAVFVAVCSSAVPYMLDMMAMRRLSARDLGVLFSLDPAVAGFSGWLLLGESLSGWQCVGISLIIIASLGNVLAASRPKSETIAEIMEA
ncbi:transporter EamA [Ameyamaea chiangmaiensis NBRC 103196]|uniref:EamA family transporter n=1 Tax=Ameyamaea chiangmaiensis TaxID=442969 RepID=UPI0021568374|nr:transporter EamA [Ameyamaea chiangmaiensis NBRC 103196]